MRAYERTHGWINFTLDLRQATPATWMLLGEAQSKAQHIAGAPLLPEVQKHFYRVFLAKGVKATTAIEGNTLTEEEVLKNLRGELEVPPSKRYLKQEIDNIIDACNEIGPKILTSASTALRPEDILAYNAQVLRGLKLPGEVVAGRLRQHEVGVGRYLAAPYEDLPYLLDRLCRWLNDEIQPWPGFEIAFGILKAVLAHLYLAWIHPFGDGNGRTARLVEFQILLSAGVPSVAAHLLSNHYNETRAEYYRQLDVSHHQGGKPLAFIEYALQGFVDGLKQQIETIKAQQLLVHWRNHIHAAFSHQETSTALRRRRLALDLSTTIVPITKVRHISPQLAEAYANKTDKTVRRDLKALEEKQLIIRTSQGVCANINLMLAFLPLTRNSANEET